jgi:superfamily II DNA or RNA helicase
VVRLCRGNSFTTIEGADTSTLWRLSRALVVPLDQWDKGQRFGQVFKNEDGQIFGSLLHGNRVAAGLTTHVISHLRSWEIRGVLMDTRSKPETGYPLFSVAAPWRPYQEDIHKKILEARVGVIDAPPRSGKTLMAARAVDVINLPTLYLAPSVAIVGQVYRVFVSHFGEELVARLDGHATPRQRDITKQIVIATTPSALLQSPEWFKTRQVLVIDEFHHGAAESYHKVNALAENAYYRICFTGTHFRTQDDRLAMEAVCSHVIARLPVAGLVADGYLAQPRVVFTQSQAPRFDADWPEAYERGIVESDERNALVVKIATMLGIHNNIPTIILTKRRPHADLLGKMIGSDAVVVKGGEAGLTDERLEAFRKGKVPIVIGTSVLGEGVDLPNAGALVYASSGGGSVTQIQSYFRPLTRFEGKQSGRIFDFIDTQHPILLGMSRARMENCEQHVGPVVR